MKNFPNQYSKFSKLRGTLETVRDLRRDGKDAGANDVLGSELARRGIYTFGRDAGPIADLLAAERLKPRGRRGSETAARELPRTLRHLGWLAADLELTASGERLLETATGGEDELRAWQQALIELELSDGGGRVSHPVRILLRLVADHAIVVRRGLELVLEAHDDSDAEYARISALARLSHEERRQALGASTSQMDNAIKIFPSFAEQAGFIERAAPRAPYKLTDVGRIALDEGYAARGVTVRSATAAPRPAHAARRPRPVTAGAVSAPAAPRARAALSPEEQIAATRLGFERTVRHQELLRRLVALRERPDVELLEDPASFDLLEVPARDEPLTLYELKTIEVDEATQTRRAIGQLLYYEHLDVRPAWPGREVRRVAVFERRIDAQLATLLDEVEIAAFALEDGALVPLNERAEPSAPAAV